MKTRKYRIESDSLGNIEVEDQYYWGAQTQRSLQNFDIGNEKIPIKLIHAFALQKVCAAEVNKELGTIAEPIANAICNAGEDIIQGKYDNNFPLSVWQTGSGTHTNMNINEVIANIANERLGNKKGAKSPVHPNDHVNMSQSSNDSFPTVMNIATAIAITQQLLPALEKLYINLDNKAQEWHSIIKIGRTHLQDATPLTLGQEFSGYSTQIGYSIDRIKSCMQRVCYLAQGGTAVGTGINCPQSFPQKFVEGVRARTGIKFISAPNKFASISCHDNLVELSGILNVLAVSLMKIVNDIRLLGSGPRCGIGELILPSNEPGSSIMPGKVNPTQVEALNMVCAQVMGNHVTITISGSSGHLELNAFKPVIIYNLLQSVQLLADGVNSFNEKCLLGLQPNRERIKQLCEQSLMLVTALNPHIGYDNAAKIARKAYQENITLKAAAVKLNLLTAEDFDKYVRIEKMVSSTTNGVKDESGA